MIHADLTVESYTPPSAKISEGKALIVRVKSNKVIEVKDGLKLNYTGAPSSEFIISGDRIAFGATTTDIRLLQARADGITEVTETFEFNLDSYRQSSSIWEGRSDKST